MNRRHHRYWWPSSAALARAAVEPPDPTIPRARSCTRVVLASGWGHYPAGMDRVDGAARRRGPRRRRLARTLAAVALAAVALVSPLESGLLPGPAAGLALQPDAAIAQASDGNGNGNSDSDGGGGNGGGGGRASVVDGTPDPCDAAPLQYEPDEDDPSLCVLEVPACPESRLTPGELMKLSLAPDDIASKFPDAVYPQADGYERYPEFCEEQVNQIDDPQGYADCTTSLGVAVKYDDAVCRIFYPIKCPSGVLELARVGSHTCRAVKRRNWTCGAGYLHGNKFPICFRRIEFAAGEAVPACQGSVPDLGVFKEGRRACETYVGSDVLAAPGEIACSDYTTGDFEGLTGFTSVAMQANPDNRYWCRFDAAKLTLNCHGPDQPASGCTQQVAMCLKRASRTGGCDQIIETIRCRAYQTAFAQSKIDIAAVREQRCVPCVNLPFQSPTCQDETTRQTDRFNPYDKYRYGRQEAILRCRVDFTEDALRGRMWYPPSEGRQLDPCPTQPAAVQVSADPPSGTLEWSSNHFSQLAVVNSAVVVRIVDLPFEVGTVSRLRYRPNWSDRTRVVEPTSRTVLLLPDPDLADRLPRQLIDTGGIRPDRSYASLHAIASGDGRSGRECVPLAIPVFDLLVQGLWPDKPGDRSEIEALFGADALDGWWDDRDLSGEELEARRRRLTEARGLQWWGDLTVEQRRVRDAQQIVTVECHVQARECVWRPLRSGYYKLVGGGGWQMQRSVTRAWGAEFHALACVYGHPNCRSLTPAQAFAANMEQFTSNPGNRSWLLGQLRARGLTLEDAGLEDADGFITLRAPDGDTDWLYSEAARGLTGCPTPIDLRVLCPGSGGAGNYTETPPVGVVVHEIQTRTRPAADQR